MFGASPTAWSHLAELVLPDLLPVVSDPTAKISEKSKLKDIGKVPSVLNADGEVVGLAAWTTKQATEQNVRKWSAAGYGLAIQTRHVRGLDVDVETEQANKILDAVLFWAEVEGLPFPPMRSRGTNKFLLAFATPGDWAKRIIRTSDGNIEFLANGQQFVAVGTHPSGSRYVWRDPGITDNGETEYPESFPEYPSDAVGRLLAAISTTFGKEDIIESLPARRPAGMTPAGEDDVARYLLEQDWVHARGPDGSLFIRCPFEDGHSKKDDGGTSTVYFPAGGRGYQTGHFKCLHASCASRKDGDFLAGIGYATAGLQTLESVQPGGVGRLPAFRRSGDGRVAAELNNVVLGLGSPAASGASIWYDSFTDDILIQWTEDHTPRPLQDDDYTRLRINLERIGFRTVGREMIRDAVEYQARLDTRDSAKTWLENLTWDGRARVDTFCSVYWGALDSPYARAVGRYIWTALAGRIIAPGSKADMVPILCGPQGVRKSSVIAVMAPSPSAFTELDLSFDDSEFGRRLRGVCVAEIPELRGLATRDLEHIKALVTRSVDSWIPKYKERSATRPRRCLFFGTTNEKEFLFDATGNRRWLPIDTPACDPQAITRDIFQLWAEGLALWRDHGILFAEAEELAKEIYEKYTITDSWLPVINRWLSDVDGINRPMDRWFTANEALINALGLPARVINRGHEARISRVFGMLGVVRGARTRGVQYWRAETCQHPAPDKELRFSG